MRTFILFLANLFSLKLLVYSSNLTFTRRWWRSDIRGWCHASGFSTFALFFTKTIASWEALSGLCPRAFVQIKQITVTPGHAPELQRVTSNGLFLPWKDNKTVDCHQLSVTKHVWAGGEDSCHQQGRKERWQTMWAIDTPLPGEGSDLITPSPHVHSFFHGLACLLYINIKSGTLVAEDYWWALCPGPCWQPCPTDRRAQEWTFQGGCQAFHFLRSQTFMVTPQHVPPAGDPPKMQSLPVVLVSFASLWLKDSARTK